MRSAAVPVAAGTPTYYFIQAKEAGTKFVSVDPLYNASAQMLDADWIPVRNGTDNSPANTANACRSGPGISRWSPPEECASRPSRSRGSISDVQSARDWRQKSRVCAEANARRSAATVLVASLGLTLILGAKLFGLY